MSELIPTGTAAITEVSPVADVTEELSLVAQNAEQMQLAQRQLAAWFASKKSLLESDLTEVRQELEIAERHGWRTISFKRQITTLTKRIDFYDKCQQASEAGYCLIPNLPCDVFAVRTALKHPRFEWDTNRAVAAAQRSESPPAGEGRYVDDAADTRRAHVEKIEHPSGRTEQRQWWQASNFDAEIDFPISVCKPQVMTATAQAMALKVFDEIAIVDESVSRPGVTSGGVDTRRKGDPLVLGIIRHPSRQAWNDRRITFLISWFLDTRAL